MGMHMCNKSEFDWINHRK